MSNGRQKMKRFTRETHRVHPGQKRAYIITKDSAIQVHRGMLETYTGQAVDKLAEYENLGTVEELREALEKNTKK